VLIAAECVGDGYWFIDKARTYATERVVFDRPIGMNQGVQFPIARAYANVRAADLMRYEAAHLFDSNEACGAEANLAKLLAADAPRAPRTARAMSTWRSCWTGPPVRTRPADSRSACASARPSAARFVATTSISSSSTTRRHSSLDMC